MSTPAAAALSPQTWLDIIADAFALFDNADARGLGTPPFSLGGGTALMLRSRHRSSEGVDLFGYDARWLSVLSPRLNATAAGLATDHAEGANAIKLVTPRRDIDFVVAGDIAMPVDAALPQADILLRRFAELKRLPRSALLAGIVPYADRLDHANGMLDRVEGFVRSRRRLVGGWASGLPERNPAGRRREVSGDCSFDTLDRAAAALGLSRDRVRQSYARARERHGAADGDLDAEEGDRF